SPPSVAQGSVARIWTMGISVSAAQALRATTAMASRTRNLKQLQYALGFITIPCMSWRIALSDARRVPAGFGDAPEGKTREGARSRRIWAFDGGEVWGIAPNHARRVGCWDPGLEFHLSGGMEAAELSELGFPFGGLLRLPRGGSRKLCLPTLRERPPKG